MSKAYFVSHGSPMTTVSQHPVRAEWKALGEQIAKQAPAALIVVSAHWTTTDPTIGVRSHFDAFHDFYGFPDRLYQLRYEARGAPETAEALAEHLAASGLPIAIDEKRDLDHGAWVPLRDMPALSDVPVIPVSVQPQRSPAWHIDLGRQLAGFGGNCIVLGSGSVVHNLRTIDFNEQAPVADWAAAFADKAEQLIRHGDQDGLIHLSQHPDFHHAHPTPEHWYPLLVAAGAGGTTGAASYRGWAHGTLTMDSYRWPVSA
ncbi:DODA-type extradiol aromatic ring-opening family dioxygenase [Mangrovitalea sediminis]|uniref:DODA-type extradiol aromatic ring-opening family dioxygenase n=1 Tax=Mangrovitalea sediminis TaxID=1982043 RepID=UPI000BE608C8|nr:class III extradiol ring-cleavage dioxygenase [Mangrovitalea sediminis]